MDETLAAGETHTYVKPGEPGHNVNAGKEVVWERWQKKRVFVRALEGTYGNLISELFTQPRVIRTTEMKWKGGPQMYSKTPINPGHAKLSQAIEVHLNAFAPRSYGQNHGHMNSEVMYVLRGSGHDVHDLRKIPYAQGDAFIVENACVHQHFNDTDNELVLLVMKAKPLFLFMHMLFQKMVKYPPCEPTAEALAYSPPADI
jgi:quercetin dioxygenase-like cupin family protein